MPRKPDPGRREELLDSILEYIAEHSVAELSLRPLARALGQSTFVLTYHFGDRDGVITAALDRFERKQRELVATWSRLDGEDIVATVKRYWTAMVIPRNQQLIRLGFEIASSPRGANVARAITADWVRFVTAGLTQQGVERPIAQREATLLVATMNGLLLDLVATGERHRVEEALAPCAQRLERVLATAPAPS